MLFETKNGKSKPLREALIDVVLSSIEANNELTSTVDFFDLGLDSLQTISLAKQINAYLIQSNSRSKPVTPKAIYTNPSIEKLEPTLLDETHTDDHAPPETEMQAIFKGLSRSLPKARGVHISYPPKSPAVLLTGSTGSLGSYVPHIYCITNGPDSKSRQTTSFEPKGLNADFEKVTFLPCDFPQQFLDLDEATYQNLKQQVTHIIHNGWDVNLYRCLDAFITPHVSGVRHLIDFCIGSTYNAQFMFISTQSTSLGLPAMRDRALPEESSSTWESSQDMGYAQSKLIAEQLLDKAAQISGLRTIVCRVGQIAGPTDEKGVWNVKKWFPSLIATSVKMGKLPSDLGTMDNIDWIPVKLVAKNLMGFAAEEYLGFNGEALWVERNGDASPSEPPLMNSGSDVTPEKLSPLTLTADPKPEEPIIATPFTADSAPNQTTNSVPSLPTPNPSSSTSPKSKTFNIVNPHATTYPSLISFIQSSISTPLQPIPLSDWLQILRHASDTPEAASKLPALKVLNFIESFLRPEEAPKGTLSTLEAVKYSQTMKELTPVGEKWTGVWMRQWEFEGSKEH
ncbi:MAG: hypothetical protein Q9166_008218 [cf. Caloplaca sp. 2 TL-2023]